MIKRLLITLLVFCSLISVPAACKRIKEKPADFKREFYLSSSALGIGAVLEGIYILGRNKVFSPETVKAGEKIILSAAKTWVEADAALHSGDLSTAKAKIKAAVDFLKRLESENAFSIENPNIRQWWAFVVELGYTGFLLVESFINSPTGPQSVSRDLLVRVQEANGVRATTPVFLIELANLVIATRLEVEKLIDLQTPEEVRKKGQDIIGGIISKLEPVPLRV